MNGIDPAALDWAKGGGLLPAIVQHGLDGRVLMQGWMNREALERTLMERRVTFYSRSKGRLWTKGERSGHSLALQSAHADCDADAILLLAEPAGPVCHRGTDTCFDEAAAPALSFLGRLDALIAERARTRPAGSYTSALFEAGVRRIAQKVGEEGVEAALAGASQDDEALLDEAADLLFHLAVLLRARGRGLAEVAARLQARHDAR
ncbi:phosphoribosyl-AMP cyclohydrolase [Mizugakiibacter sediminis]|uniref:Histidine biosynthesis bifunctional protein HisIE n=1 Tax=Mizugakiibacter sediminis TaxID=1475481 RepID=A0A0K8QRE6_9GAMM|nr:bifunctional phosphoribosyl-AMP cyclohydrolase/phosphoribosyl-ATP diphosphatase HisIE [Mizugakiibacter sediminis]GAP67470.1 phosphoribosyl-AMP cyclohydrolase [Mizugakiibacter sediminis]